MSKSYGYARCSLADERRQDLNRQVRTLKAAGVEEIITEREHGDSRVKQNLDLLKKVHADLHRGFATVPQYAAIMRHRGHY